VLDNIIDRIKDEGLLAMKAYQYNDSADGLQLQEIPVPEPGVDEVLIRVRAAGMCHSDCHMLTGAHDNMLIRRPITLGHEVAGEIIKKGSNVVPYRVGERIAVYQIMQPAEERDMALSIGTGYDGGYAEFAVVPISRIKPLPDGVSFAQAAVAMDALATSYHAVAVRARVKQGMVVGIIGLGGLGMSGLAFGVLQGAKVFGFDLETSKFDEAKRLGATECFKSIEEAKDVVFDVIVDFVGADATVYAACSGIRPSGTVVVVGVASSKVSVPLEKLIMNGFTLVGSLGASKETCDRVIELLEQGSVNPSLTRVPFHDIPATLNILATQTRNEGRYWADPSELSSQ
jgi:propanol-preferring alcohol dehydrogenase